MDVKKIAVEKSLERYPKRPNCDESIFSTELRKAFVAGFVAGYKSSQQIVAPDLLPHTDERVEWDDENLIDDSGELV